MKKRVEQLLLAMEKRIQNARMEISFAEIAVRNLRNELDDNQLKLSLGDTNAGTTAKIYSEEFIGRKRGVQVPSPF